MVLVTLVAIKLIYIYIFINVDKFGIFFRVNTLEDYNNQDN